MLILCLTVCTLHFAGFLIRTARTCICVMYVTSARVCVFVGSGCCLCACAASRRVVCDLCALFLLGLCFLHIILYDGSGIFAGVVLLAAVLCVMYSLCPSHRALYHGSGTLAGVVSLAVVFVVMYSLCSPHRAFYHGSCTLVGVV